MEFIQKSVQKILPHCKSVVFDLPDSFNLGSRRCQGTAVKCKLKFFTYLINKFSFLDDADKQGKH